MLVEGDALTIIEKVRVTKEDKSNINTLVKEIKERIQRFDNIEF
ncbi:hypothetical protein Goshw_021627 [Gossypium schwendimanii]|uniref:RNase H type-1 domain-containing protein n=1 Tax=Gossypium schwendimanii TaxID=34291 RepID=A0A7J9LPZ3_GOSSC|nr:hypothetical protein [Gossypium schwendimanii]